MLKEIIKNTLMLLGKEDELVEVESVPEEEFSDSTSKIVSSLVKITSLVLSDITREVSRLTEEKIVKSNEYCEIPYTDLGRKIIGVKSVKSGLFPVTFNLYPEYIKVGRPNQEYTVEFHFENEKCKSINDKIVLPIGITTSAVSYGVASEYASIHLLYDECNMWEQKFVRAMENVRAKSGERRAFRWWK